MALTVLPKTTRTWKLKRAPVAAVSADTFEMVTESVPDLEDGQILIQTIYFSNDPSQRASIHRDMSAERLYTKPVREGETVNAYGIGKVLITRSEKHAVGTLVIASMGWREYTVVPAELARPLPNIPGVSPTLSLGYLGGPALTAWFGLHDVSHVKPEHTVLISGAAGATGCAAVQIAKKIIGAKRVIGIAGGADKCAWVKSLGADECIDYKSSFFEKELVRATDGFVDVYLDLVGGEMLNLILSRMKRFGHIAAVGSISTYNDHSRSNLPNWFEVISNRLTITGYIVFDYVHKYPEAIGALVQAMKEGNITVEGGETICEVGFEKVPEVWAGLFEGSNRGKLVTKLM